MKSIFVDWSSEYNNDTWDFVGRNVLETKRGVWSSDNQDGIEEDDGYPICNFAYPLYSKNIEDEIILKACEMTNCTVVYNTKEDAYYLALTGCGMDMSQDIALAYMIIDGCIDWDFLDSVYVSGPLSVSKSNYIQILEELNRQVDISISNYNNLLVQIKEKLSEYAANKMGVM